MTMKTTTPILSPLEYEILEWAINTDLFEKVENGSLSGWNSWDRTGVLTRERFVIDWQTPNIANYSELILRRLRALKEGARDRYAEIAKDLEKRIRRSNQELLRNRSATKPRTYSVHG
jgi:hypothetical protein